jgi:hypothetical protein
MSSVSSQLREKFSFSKRILSKPSQQELEHILSSSSPVKSSKSATSWWGGGKKK